MTNTPSNLLHPLGFDVVGFKEEDHDYHFHVALQDPKCCQSCGTTEGRLVKFGKDDQAYHYRAIFTNITESTVIDLLPNRNMPTIVNFLSHLPNRNDIQIVCADMWNPYREATKVVLPHASLVVDKFHITRMANESMEVVRKSLKSSLTAPQRRTLKGDRKALLTRYHDLKDWQHLTMETWLNAFPELKVAYDLKEGFYSVWDASCDKEARERYAKWKAEIPAEQKDVWAPLTKAMENWQNEIFCLL